MKYSKAIVAASVACAIAAAALASAASAVDRGVRPRATTIDSYMKALAAAGRFSGVVVVERRGKVLLSKGYGLADDATRTPNTPSTGFRIASITKTLTAAALLQLQKRGLLDLDDSVCKYIAGCPP